MGTKVSIHDIFLESGETIHCVLPLVRRTEAEGHKEGEIKQFLIISSQDLEAHPVLLLFQMATLEFLMNFNI